MEQRSVPCWYNVEFPQFKGTLYLSYKAVHGDLKKYIDDSRTLSIKHLSKASGLQEIEIEKREKKVFGIYYKVKGNSASSVQFYLTDSSTNFLRGALYFYAVPNPDSIAPVLRFVEEEVNHLTESFSWK